MQTKENGQPSGNMKMSLEYYNGIPLCTSTANATAMRYPDHYR